MSEGISSGLADKPFGDTARPLPVLFGPRRAPLREGKKGQQRVARFFPDEGTFRCPVPGCPQGQEGAGCKTSFNLRYHFAYRHPADTVVVRGECPPKCKSCGLQVWTADTSGHLASKTCKDLTAQRQQHSVAAASAAAVQHKFTAYNKELKRVEQFKYLGRMMSMDDNDVPAMRRNLKKARRTWGRLRKVLEKEEVAPKVAGMFYQAVIASVLLYGSETWVLPPSGLKALEGFHVECARRLTGMRPKKEGGKWTYPKSADVLQAAGLRTIADCIALRRANIAKTISDRRILKECREAERRRGSPPRMMWWDQKLDFVKEGNAGGGLGFVMRQNSNDDQVFGRRNSMEDHHSRLRRQMAEEMGREVEAPPPLHPPQGGAVPWHHRSGPVGGGLNIVPAEEAAALRRAMPRVLMPGIPPHH